LLLLLLLLLHSARRPQVSRLTDERDDAMHDREVAVAERTAALQKVRVYSFLLLRLASA
jgi:C4-dicarboxylate-specific signal transduction histidine kinase